MGTLVEEVLGNCRCFFGALLMELGFRSAAQRATNYFVRTALSEAWVSLGSFRCTPSVVQLDMGQARLPLAAGTDRLLIASLVWKLVDGLRISTTPSKGA